jgi:O-antigen/teichoic acid export membrane protein
LKKPIIPFLFRISNLSSLQFFQLVRYATFVAIGICLAKIGLSQSTIGEFETFILVSGMVSFFWVSGIINSMLSLYPKKENKEQQVIFFNTFISFIALSLVVACLLFLFSQNLFSFLEKEQNGKVVQLSVIYLLLNNPSFLAEYILFLNNRAKTIVVYGLATSVVTVAATVLPVVLGYEITFAFYGLIGVALLRLGYTIFLLSKYAAFHLDYLLMKEHFKISLPVILSLFVSGSAEYIDGIIVKAKFDNLFFAVYRYGAKELPVLLIVANAFSTAMISPIAKNFEDGLLQLKAKSLKLMHLFFPLTIVLMMVSPYLYKYVFSQSFIYSAIIFNIYLLLIIPRVLFPQTILTAIGQTRFLFYSSVLEIIINVSLSIYLSGVIGLPGIAIGTFVAYTFDKFFLMATMYFVFKISPKKYVQLNMYFVYSLLTFVAFGIGYKILLCV